MILCLISMTPAQIDALDSYCLGGGANYPYAGDPVCMSYHRRGLVVTMRQLDANEVVADIWAEDEDSFQVHR